MKENEGIGLLLMANNFQFDKTEGIWFRDLWNFRFLSDGMEVYENGGMNRYFYSPIVDSDIVELILRAL